MLQSYDDAAFEIKRLHLQSVEFPGLFESKKLLSYAFQTTTSSTSKTSATPKKLVNTAAAVPVAPAPVAATPKKLFNPNGLVKTPKAVSFTSEDHHFAPSSVRSKVEKENDDDGFTTIVKRPTIDPSKVSVER